MPIDALQESLTERRILAALIRGDEQAIRDLYDLYGAKIYRFAYRMLGHSADAEDATAETFLRVYRRSAELREGPAFRTWLYRIARNLCIDRQRQRALLPLSVDIEDGGTEERSMLRVTVRQAVESLPAEYREPVIYCDMENLSAKEAADILNISVPALKSRLYRARRALRDKLGCLVGAA